MTKSPLPIDALYQFYIITPLNSVSCSLVLENYIEAKSPIKKLIIFLILKKVFKRNFKKGLYQLFDFVKTKNNL